jgi:hypothetical protein
MALVFLAAAAAFLGQPALAEARSSLLGSKCYSAAADATEREYGKYYKADWYIDLRAIVKAKNVQTVEVHVGPYDGSAGGGISASYACDTGKLTFVEQER